MGPQKSQSGHDVHGRHQVVLGDGDGPDHQVSGGAKSDYEWISVYIYIHLICMIGGGRMARAQGFEPRLSGPEPDVLPLDYARALS